MVTHRFQVNPEVAAMMEINKAFRVFSDNFGGFCRAVEIGNSRFQVVVEDLEDLGEQLAALFLISGAMHRVNDSILALEYL